VKVAEILLKAGAEVDAMAEIYGGSTTLGLVATSIHPMRAGVQNALIQTLLDYGAGIDHPGAAATAFRRQRLPGQRRGRPPCFSPARRTIGPRRSGRKWDGSIWSKASSTKTAV